MQYCGKWIGVAGALMCVFLSGCALFNSPQPQPPQRSFSPVESFIVTRTPGGADAVGMVSDPKFGDNLRIVLEQEFLSAAGDTCRRASLFSQRGEAEVVVMCREEQGEWVMIPRVWGRGLSQKSLNAPAPQPEKPVPSVPAPTPAPQPEKLVVPSVSTPTPAPQPDEPAPQPEKTTPDIQAPGSGIPASAGQ